MNSVVLYRTLARMKDLDEAKYVDLCIKKAIHEGNPCCYVVLTRELKDQLREAGFTVETLTYISRISGWAE